MDETIWYWHNKILNGWYDMILTYMRCQIDESRWYRHTRDVKQMSWDDIDIHEMLKESEEMILAYMRC